MTRLLFDVSSLPDVHKSVSGISRVILSCLRELQESNYKNIEIGGISFRPNHLSHNKYRIFTLDEVSKFNETINQFIGKIKINTHDYDEGLKSSDIIIGLGEQWLFPESINILMEARRALSFKVVTLIHDLVPFFMPELYWPGFCTKYISTINSLVELSDLLLVNSENTNEDLLKLIPAANKKIIKRVHLGADLSIKKVSLGGIVRVHAPYILCVGTIQPRKNHLLLLFVWRILIAKKEFNCPTLVLVGKKGWNVDDLLYCFENNQELKKLILIIEEPSDEELADLYKNSIFTIYPSLYEGWGLPVAESLSYGKLCLTSNSSSMPEVGGIFCEYFSPYDPAELANLIIRFTLDKSALHNAERKIKCEYAPFTWRGFAEEMLLSIEQIADQNGIEKNEK